AVIADVDLVDETQLIDVRRYFRVIDRLERCDDVIRELVELVLWHSRRTDHRRILGRPFRNGIIGDVIGHAKNSCALMRDAASVSTSSLVLYIPKEARQVAVSPWRARSGITQGVPAGTATP